MIAVRLIAALATVATLWLAVSISGHGPAPLGASYQHETLASAGLDDAHGPAMVDCCGSESDRGTPCQSLHAIPQINASAIEQISFASLDALPALPLPTGREPLGLLDPPRPV